MGSPAPAPDVLQEEEELRVSGLVAAIVEAQKAEKQREDRLRRAKSKEEAKILEKRFTRERRRDAQGIMDLQQDREAFRRSRKRGPTPRPSPPRSRSTDPMAFYTMVYKQKPKLHPISEALPSEDECLRERRELLRRLETIDELICQHRPHTAASSTSSSTSSSLAAFDLAPSRPSYRPRAVPPLGIASPSTIAIGRRRR